MRVLLPYDAREPNTRLSPLLTPDERTELAEAMLSDVLEAVRGAGGEPTILSTGQVDVDAPVTIDDRPLSPAIDDALADADGPLAVVMADLALATPAALAALFDADGEVVLAPGLGGGTNAMVVRHSDFHVDYHGASIRDHRRIARAIDSNLATVDSFRLAVDVDEPPDLVEVLLHGDGRAADWLRDRGFEVVVSDEGRPTVDRPE